MCVSVFHAWCFSKHNDEFPEAKHTKKFKKMCVRKKKP